MADQGQNLVTLVGVVHHVTSLGVFLDVDGRRVSWDETAWSPLDSSSQPATLRVERWFATQESLESFVEVTSHEASATKSSISK